LRVAQNPPHLAFSTISFDDHLFDSNTLSPSTPGRTSFKLKQPSVQNNQTVSITPQQLSAATRDSTQKFHQQIQLWTSTNPRIAPYKAEESLARLWVEQQELFQQWEQQQQQIKQTTLPSIILTTESVNLVLQAWCLSNNGEIAAKRAERLLNWMEDLHSSKSISEVSATWSSFLPKPNYQSYTTVVDAWSRAAVYESHNLSSSPSPKHETKSGGRTKNKVISEATKNGFECAKSSEDILMHMQRMHERQLQMAEENSENYNLELQPDTRVFNLVLKAWSKISGGTKASAIRAMRILDLMQELHHSQAMHAAEWQGILLSKVQPNLQTYKSVINAWAYATHTTDGPDRAEEILRHLLSLSKAGNMGIEIMPDVECFHIVMKSHAESVRKRRKGDDGSASAERAKRVTSLLDWMELLALRRGVTTAKIQPTSESYRLALSAWVWSNHVNAPKEAEGILNQMIHACDANMHAVAAVAGNDANVKNNVSDLWAVRPETRDFNTLINCCSFARKVGADTSEEDEESLLQRQIDHQEIFDIAEGALNTLISSPYAEPDSATFSGMIRASLNLLQNTTERDDMVIKLFRLAYQAAPSETPASKIVSTSSERMRAPPGAGCVDANVLRQLRHALPSTEDYIRVREEFEDYRRQNVDK